MLVRMHVAKPTRGRVYATWTVSSVPWRSTAVVATFDAHGAPSRKTATATFRPKSTLVTARRSGAATRASHALSCARDAATDPRGCCAPVGVVRPSATRVHERPRTVTHAAVARVGAGAPRPARDTASNR